MGYLNLLNACRTGTRALGPGLRYVIWVQGCPFSCPGCITPEGREIEAKLMTTSESVAEDILSRPYIVGLTVSGGEPFLQSASLSDLIRRIRTVRPNFNVIIFTGYRLEHLTWHDAEDLLSLADVVIDGQYREDLDDGIGLRGSSNQRILFLSDRLTSYKDEMEKGCRRRDIEIRGAETLFIGIPDKKGH